MNLPITVTQDDLLEILLNVAPNRPVFIWGAPGIGKSALVEQFADEIGLPYSVYFYIMPAGCNNQYYRPYPISLLCIRVEMDTH